MKPKYSLILLLAAFIAGIAQTPSFGVEVKGEKLSDIADIVQTATSSDLQIDKYSLILYERTANVNNDGGGGLTLYKPRLFTLNADGSLRKPYDIDGWAMDDSILSARSGVVQRMDLAVTDKPFGSNNSRNVMFSLAGLDSYASRYGFKELGVSGTDDDASLLQEGGVYRTTDDNRQSWGVGHLNIKGMENTDVFVLCYTDTMDTSGNMYLSFLDGTKIEELYTTKVREYRNGIRGVSIATGDLDNDGYKNEIAVCFNDNADIRYDVFTVSTSDGTNITVDRLLDNYLIHDGITGDYYMNFFYQACPNALIGDFDGDGKYEAACVARVFPGGSSAANNMRVGILKYDNGDWDYSSNSINNGYNEGPCKATVADLDGDGKDEIVRLCFVSMGDGYTPYIYPTLERWYCDKGSISPICDTNTYKGGRGSDALLGFTLAGNYLHDSNVIAEAFSITAGPFTGTTGGRKFIDDIAVSYVYNDASKVFVFPSQLDEERKFKAFGDRQTIYEATGDDSTRRGGLIAANFANEGLILAKPEHTVSPEALSYAVILQAVPYHVDNIEMTQTNGVWTGTRLTNRPINYTFSGFENGDGNGQMSVSYESDTTNSQSSKIEFTNEGTTETIMAVDKLGEQVGLDNAGEYVHGYLKFQQIQANAAAQVDKRAAPAAGIINTVMDLVTDKVESTKTQSNSTASSITISSGFKATGQDGVLAYTANQHIWRYKILNDPLPSWYVFGKRMDQDYDDSDISSEGDHYLTFSMYDEPMQSKADSEKISSYQPIHEEGNFFSYPPDLTLVEGYNAAGALSSAWSVGWSKSISTNDSIEFTKAKTDMDQSEEKVTVSETSKAINFLGSLFGNDNALDLPPYTSHNKTFTKSYSSKEKIRVNIQGRDTLAGDNAAGHTLSFLPYVAKEGTLKVAGAVMLDTSGVQYLWSAPNSLYNQHADPSLVLPQKFLRDGSSFKVNPNAFQASLLRGMRFFVPDLKIYSNSKLIKGMTYKIQFPIYNASFVDADNVTVRLSYFPASQFHIGHPYVHGLNKTVIGTTTVSLKGWDNATNSNKKQVEFTWRVPLDDSMPSGNYEFYVELDPDNAITEVHESRIAKNVNEVRILDVGGNNEGHFPFYVFSASDKIATKKNRPISNSGMIYHASLTGGDSVRASYLMPDPTFSVWADVKFKVDSVDSESLQAVYTLLKRYKDAGSNDEPVQVNCEINIRDEKNEGYIYPEVLFYGYNYKPGNFDNIDWDTVTEEELEERAKNMMKENIASAFLRHDIALYPDQTTRFTMTLRPKDIDWENGAGFGIMIPSLSVADVKNVAESADVTPGSGDVGPESGDVTPESGDSSVTGVSSSSGGCDSGLGLLGLGIILSALIIRRKTR